MSLYRLSRQGEELVYKALEGAVWSDNNGHDIDWNGIRISVKTRGTSGAIGQTAFVFSHFNDKKVVYILVGITKSKHYFWVISSKELKAKKSYYASIKESVEYEELADRIASYV